MNFLSDTESNFELQLLFYQLQEVTLNFDEFSIRYKK
jgi:hypothetical protein